MIPYGISIHCAIDFIFTEDIAYMLALCDIHGPFCSPLAHIFKYVPTNVMYISLNMCYLVYGTLLATYYGRDIV